MNDDWIIGPNLLQNQNDWPTNIITEPTKESECEAKMIREVLSVAIFNDDYQQKLLSKYNLWKTLRIMSWVKRFVLNCRQQTKEKIYGPITTNEINEQKLQLMYYAQKLGEKSKQFENQKECLNLQVNSNGLYECRGRIQGHYPVFIPRDSLLAEKIVQDAHLRTIHGGVIMTMAEVRQCYWIPKLRSLVKKVRKNCYGCKRFQVTALAKPPPGNLPLDRNVGSRAFQVVGVDYAGPLYFKVSQNKEAKAYILLFSCSLTRAIHLQALQDLSTDEFIRSLKIFIDRRGRPEKIYSDNAKTFESAARWIKKVVKNENVHDFLAKNNVKWQFNLS